MSLFKKMANKTPSNRRNPTVLRCASGATTKPRLLRALRFSELTMLKSYKNGFIDIIQRNSFEPSEFKRYEKEVDNHPAFILQLGNSPLFFMTRTNSEDYHELDLRYIKFAPDYPKTGYYPEHAWTNISDVYEVFENWLHNDVKCYLDEIDAPDLWGQIEGRHLFDEDPMSNRSDRAFDKAEKERVRAALIHFKHLVEIEFKPSQDQLEVIYDRLDYLSEALDRLNKVDWQGLAVSTVISISIALSLDTERGKSLFQVFKQAFASATKFLGN